jgi:hypothetical protein
MYQPGFEEVDTSVQACVPFYGVYDVAGIIGDSYSKGIRDDFFAPSVFQKDPKTDPEPFYQASPLYHVNGDEPDFLVIHGANDSLVRVTQARAFVARLKEVSKHTVTYLELPRHPARLRGLRLDPQSARDQSGGALVVLASSHPPKARPSSCLSG